LPGASARARGGNCVELASAKPEARLCGLALLHPLLLLSINLFVYRVVLVQLPGTGSEQRDFVFCACPVHWNVGGASAGTPCLKQNMHLVKNVMLPIELVPLRSVLSSLATQMVGLAILFALLAPAGHASWKLVLLPLVIMLEVLMLIGIVLVLACIAVALTDVGYFVNLLVMLLMFVSPIGFTRDMVPAPFGILVDANPVTYLVEAYRGVLLAGYPLELRHNCGLRGHTQATITAGAAFFARFKGALVDDE